MHEVAGLLLLPPPADVESVRVLKSAARAHRALAELKGMTGQILNSTILIDTLTLREAKESSAIENIVTTHDELFRAELFGGRDSSAREVARYAAALKTGFASIRAEGLLRMSLVRDIQQELVGNDAGFRRQAGTVLRNDRTGEVIYEPPQHPDDIRKLLENLEVFLHADSALDPLVRMAIAHHQFEAIHPFYDGNGRTGRIINVLFLVKEDLLTLPILYLSRYILRRKDMYYRLLQKTRQERDYEEWLVFMLDGVTETSAETSILIAQIQKLMLETKRRMRDALPKVYSQDLLNNLFRHPYTRIAFVMHELGVTRVTATKYLDQLAAVGLVTKHKVARDNYFVNEPLVRLLAGDARQDDDSEEG